MTSMTSLLIATRNQNKLREISVALGGHYRLLSLQDFPEAPAVAEDQPTFAANAMKKARELARFLQRIAGFDFRVPGVNALIVADDSGLEVDALKGAPGVRSARFAAPEGAPATTNSSDAENNAKLVRLLREVPPEKRTARFRCVIAAVRVKPPQPAISGQTFEGVCDGRIQLEARGRGGFGYDPLFVPQGHAASFAELGAHTKNQISHRALALQKLQHYLRTLRL